MGMFDYVFCEYPLPSNPPQWVIDHARAGKFRTKDSDRRCRNRSVPTETIHLEARPLLQWIGSIRSTPIGEAEVHDIHRDLRFYTCSNDEPGVFYEYVACFTNGRLRRITGGLRAE